MAKCVVKGWSVMNSLSKLTLDGEKRKLTLNGRCFEVLDLCKAMCCRRWDVSLLPEEIKSGLYKIQIFCFSTDKNCENELLSCLYREYRLEKKSDGACVYLNKKNKCSIYGKRPKACRKFNCKQGWELSSIYRPLEDKININNNKLIGNYCSQNLVKQKLFFVHAKIEKDFTHKLNDKMLFVLSPLEKVENLFYLKRKNKVIVFFKAVDKCGLAIG